MVHDYPVVTSTNDEAKSLLLHGAAEGTVVRAQRQTAGRGRRGRQWVSEPGNLYCSLILVPSCPLAQISQLSFVMAVAVGQATLPFLAGPEVLSYKWPNDLLLQGEKVAGILIETEGQTCIVGIGVNVQSLPNQVAYPVTALNHHTKVILSQEDLLSGLLEQISYYYHVWQKEGFEPVRSQWMQRAYGLGKTMGIKTGAKEMSGQFLGLSPLGELLLRESDGFLHKLMSAEIS